MVCGVDRNVAGRAVNQDIDWMFESWPLLDQVLGQQAGVSLQFDNMNNRAPKGTTDWQQYSVVVDVPAEASALAYGFFLDGTGKLWVNSTKIETVGPEVPSTNVITKPIDQARNLPKAPVNLGFGP